MSQAGAFFEVTDVQFDHGMLAVKGVDGEVSIARREGPVRIVAMTRLIADTLGGDNYRMAYGGGGTLRLGRFLALAGDVASLTSRSPNERIAWSAGLHIALPNTPHTLSLHVSNANTSTLQGLSRGGSERRWGFEFTIPVHLSRFFTNGEPLPAAPEAAAVATAAKDSVSMPPTVQTKVVEPPPVKPADKPTEQPPPTTPVTQPTSTPVRQDTAATRAAPPRTTAAAPTRNPQPSTSAAAPTRTASTPRPQPKSVNARIKGQAFVPGTIEVSVGSSVSWKNLDALIHTVTAADKSFDSGIIQAEGSYSHTFTKAGSYPVICTVHPFMKATVVVK